MTPDYKLSQKYNTGDIESNRSVMEQLYKQASVLGAISAVGMGMLRSSDLSHQKHQAEQLNQQFNEIEYERMAPSTQPLRHTHAPPIISAAMSPYVPVGMDEGMVRIAAAAGADLADLEKNAFGQGFTALGKGAGSAVKNLFSSVGSKASELGNKLFKAPNMPKVAPTLSMKPQTGALAAPKPQTAHPAQPSVVQPKPQVQAPPQPQPGVVNPPSASNINTATGAAPGKGFLERTGLFDAQGNFRKYRTLATVGAIGAGILGYKALKGGINWMGQESAPANYGTGGPQLATSVNQYGQPQFGG